MNLLSRLDNPVVSVPGKSTPVCRVREVNLDDYAAVTSLQIRYGLSTRSYDDWAHLWINNPTFASVRDSWPMGWVLEDASHQVVGYIGSVPLTYELGGMPLIVAAGYSWVVDEEYRSYAMWLMDTYFSHPAALYLNTTVGEQAVAAFSLFGSMPVPVGAWDGRAFVITNYRGVVESALRLRKIPASTFLSYFIAPFLYLLDRYKFRKPPIKPQLQFSFVDTFDSRFDTFWLELKKSFPEVLLGNRSLSALQWHFAPALAQGNVWILTRTSGDRLLAYAIFVRRDRPEIALTRIRLADFQSLDGENTLLIPMLQWATERCRSEGIDMLEVIGYERENKELLTLLPHQLPMPSWQYYYLSKDKKLSAQLNHTKAWRPYPFDGDATL